MIDIVAEREAYNNGTIADILWISNKQTIADILCMFGKCSLADSMTKNKIIIQFVEALETTQLKFEIEQSVESTVRSRSYEKDKG